MHPYFVEFLGTLFLVCVIFITGNWLAIGGALALAIYLGHSISIGAFNPAVTAAMYLKGKVSQTELMYYIIAQMAGGVAAYYLYTFGLKKVL